jgi:hypothetical protein
LVLVLGAWCSVLALVSHLHAQERITNAKLETTSGARVSGA